MTINQEEEFIPINISVLTISDTRTLEDDKSGDLLSKRIQSSGHKLYKRDIIEDDKGKIIGTNGKKCVPPTLFRLIIMILCPPLGLFLHLGLRGWLHVLIATFLTVFCFYFPGLLYVVLHVLC